MYLFLDELYRQEHEHALSIKKQKAEHQTVLCRLVAMVSVFFDEQDEALQQMEACHRSAMEELEEKISEQQFQYETSLDNVNKIIDQKEQEYNRHMG